MTYAELEAAEKGARETAGYQPEPETLPVAARLARLTRIAIILTAAGTMVLLILLLNA